MTSSSRLASKARVGDAARARRWLPQQQTLGLRSLANHIVIFHALGQYSTSLEKSRKEFKLENGDFFQTLHSASINAMNFIYFKWEYSLWLSSFGCLDERRELLLAWPILTKT